MLLHFHGGPEGQSRPEHHDVLRAVIEAGVSVFTPNVRGSSGDGRAFQHADNRYGRFAGIRDLEDSASFLVDAGLADRSRLAVSGPVLRRLPGECGGDVVPGAVPGGGVRVRDE
jgi:dipeptidyl aminopeptidase/acylaminoacyl peptidase